MAFRIAAAAVAFVLCGLAFDAVAQKRVVEDVIVSDYAPAPTSPTEMASEAAAIVVATYTGKSRSIEPPLRSGAPIHHPPSTTYAFEITEFVKFHPWLPNLGGHLEISMPGGDTEFPTYILRTRSADGETLTPNHRYVMFLAFNRVKDELYLAWGPGGLYDVTTDFVRGVGRGNWRHDHETVTAFLAALSSPPQ